MPEAVIDCMEYGLFLKNFIICLCQLRRTVSGGKGSRKNTADQESVTSSTGVSVPKMKPPFSLHDKKRSFSNSPTLEDVS